VNQLEQPEATAEPRDVYRTKALAVDVLVLIYAIAQAWQLSPQGLTAL
jgi:hypothetical protein